MRITRLRVANFRQFIVPLEIKDLGDGLNLFTGPNESGKSTLVRAIQAAFFERHKSSSVEDLRPRTNSKGGAEVEVDFEAKGQPYRLKKCFLENKRCELVIGTQAPMMSDQAEEHLAQMLGFSFPGRGASRPEHWGIPGLLWVEQGTVQEIQTAVTNAADQLRGALQNSLGAIASSAGDAVIGAVEIEHSKLLTPQGKPKAAYDEAIKNLTRLDTDLEEFKERLNTYRNQVDRLNTLNQEIHEGEETRPWDAMEALRKEAQDKLDRIGRLRDELAQHKEAQSLVTDQIQTLEQVQRDMERLDQELKDRGKALESLAEAIAEADQKHLREKAKVGALKVAYGGSVQTLGLSRQEEKRRVLTQQNLDLGAQLTPLNTSERVAQECAEKLLDLQPILSTSEISEADLKRLRKQEGELQALAIQRKAAATRLGFTLDMGCVVVLDGRMLKDKGEEILLQPSHLELPGLGILDITPGGEDLETLAANQSKLELAQKALLQKLGVNDLTEAEARSAAAVKAGQEAITLQALLDQAAPHGLSALQQNIAGLEARIIQVKKQLEELPEASSAASIPVNQAERVHESAFDAWENARGKAEETGKEFERLQNDKKNAQVEYDRLEIQISSPEHSQQVQQINEDLTEAKVKLGRLAVLVRQTDAAINAAQPEQLERDVKRYRKSGEQAFKAHQDRKDERHRIQGSLEEAGSQGIEETLAETAGKRDRAQARVLELKRRADSLILLLGLLKQKRKELTSRLMEPLKKRMDHYLGLLFEGAGLEVQENLNPGVLQRPGSVRPDPMEFDLLSYGAREQVGLICRLAYADLLKEEGRPTLIILDDALVHSDGSRLDLMKKVLFDAAERHQILLFTCHPKAWEGLGATVRTMESLRAAVMA